MSPQERLLVSTVDALFGRSSLRVLPLRSADRAALSIGSRE